MFKLMAKNDLWLWQNEKRVLKTRFGGIVVQMGREAGKRMVLL